MSTGDEIGREPTAPGSGTDTGSSSDAPTPRGASVSVGAGIVFDDPLDRLSADDTDRGWGDVPSNSADDDFTRFLNEKPPHHI
ncbi:hypothetical protein RVR_3771 [Actinacidiphila reveromycinica]|uniref:Uncharacterized protein n=1 Tax=Actinacidiphila reveromycinica TaxID=659352 RepID=A0A7U3VNR0_9ACTN|nr:hypothetical protein [Streptomyces sp. SN-593]BBA97834.1 hypothetical protein RVR_3771 [Streptomyces sp. SN-593]